MAFGWFWGPIWGRLSPGKSWKLAMNSIDFSMICPFGDFPLPRWSTGHVEISKSLRITTGREHRGESWGFGVA